jgi:hypothetical protein
MGRKKSLICTFWADALSERFPFKSDLGEVFTPWHFQPRRTLHRQTQEFELPLLQAPRPRSKKISASTGPIDSEKTTAKWRVRRDTEKADGAAPLRHYN